MFNSAQWHIIYNILIIVLLVGSDIMLIDLIFYFENNKTLSETVYFIYGFLFISNFLGLIMIFPLLKTYSDIINTIVIIALPAITTVAIIVTVRFLNKSLKKFIK
jgi:hypothetical protein